MIELDEAEITTTNGVADDFRGTRTNRQVTVLSVDQWNEACEELGQQLQWTTRRANLLVEGLSFSDCQDAALQIGSVTLQVTAETEPCQLMDDQCEGLLQVLKPDWRGGVCCRVIAGGVIAKGDVVSFTQ
jgi:MOSC domain-containing protein YiiM